MAQGKRVKLSAVQQTDLWCRWKAGQSLHTMGRAFGKPHNSIHCFLSHHGGMVPAVRRRAVLALTVVEREDISRGLASGSSIRDIAKGLEPAASTVSREVARHGGRSEYRANEADERAWDSALRPKRGLLVIHVELQKMVASKLILDWSPEQIECVHTRQQTAEVLAATALGAQPGTGAKSTMQAAKQAVVIEYPVKRRGAEDAVESLLEGHVQQVTTDEFDATAEIRLEIGTGGVEHVLGEVESHDVSARQSFQKIAGETAGAAAGIEDGFISAQ